MPQRTTITATTALSGTISPNNSTFTGLRWEVKPLLPTPADETTQAAAFITLNKDKVENVSVWQNVQYGQAPVGALRFKPCAPFVHTDPTYDAALPPNPPFQRYVDELGTDGRYDLGNANVGVYDWIGLGVKEQETCLSVNIYRPEGLSNRPVIFWIHGGNWNVYHSKAAQQLGHRLAANHGAVVVTVEYRLSTFGNFPHIDLIADDEPSIAYTDMKVALEWVNTHIGSFGGDTAKILVGGSSAGGAAVQMIMTDDDTQGWFSSALIGSGGGTGTYLPESYYDNRTRIFGESIEQMGPLLFSQNASYTTIEDELAVETFADTMQDGVRQEYVQALADARTIITADSVFNSIDGSGSAETMAVASDDVYPFKRGAYDNAIDAAKAGKFRKPFISLFTECEALNLLGEDYTTLRDALLALSTSTLDGWAQRLGYADYEGWKGAAWIAALTPAGGLEAQTSAQFKTSIDPLAADCENRRVLFTDAVFGYPAWRVAYAATETASADCWLIKNNFSANGIWAGHSTEVSLGFGNNEWLVAGKEEFPDAEVPGGYVNNRMDSFYVSEWFGQMIVALADTGDPNGAYSFTGFDLFSDAATHPADGGSLTATPAQFSLTLDNPSRINVIGKYQDIAPSDNLNAGTFLDGSIIDGLDLQRDAKLTPSVLDRTLAYLEYKGLLEP